MNSPGCRSSADRTVLTDALMPGTTAAAWAFAMPVDPPQRRADDRTFVPSVGHDSARRLVGRIGDGDCRAGGLQDVLGRLGRGHVRYPQHGDRSGVEEVFSLLKGQPRKPHELPDHLDLPVSREVEHYVMTPEMVPQCACRWSDHDAGQFTEAQLFVVQPRQRCLVPGALLPLCPAPPFLFYLVLPIGPAGSHCFGDGLPAPVDLVRDDQGDDAYHEQVEAHHVR